MDSNTRRLNIIIQCNELYPHSTGGIGMQTLNMANALHQEGHKVTVIGVYDDVRPHNHSFRFIQLRRIKKLNFLGELLNILLFQLYLVYFIKLKNNKVDVIEYPDYQSYGFFQLVNSPRLVRINHPAFYLHGKYYGAPWYQITKPLRWFMERRSIRKADKVIAAAKYLIPLISELTGRLDIAYVYNMTKAEPFNNNDFANRFIKPYILNSGSVLKYKGIDLLVTAFMEIADDLDFDLVLAGRILDQSIVEKTKGYKSKIRENRILFLGELKQEELMSVIAGAKAMVFPSLQENMPLAWCEGVGMGKPLWGSNIPAAQEIIKNGVNGFIFERGSITAIQDALVQINEMGEGELVKLSKKANDIYHDIFGPEKLYRENIKIFFDMMKR